MSRVIEYCCENCGRRFDDAFELIQGGDDIEKLMADATSVIETYADAYSIYKETSKFLNNSDGTPNKEYSVAYKNAKTTVDTNEKAVKSAITKINKKIKDAVDSEILKAFLKQADRFFRYNPDLKTKSDYENVANKIKAGKKKT